MPHITEVDLTADNPCVVYCIITGASSWSAQIDHVIGINRFHSSCRIIGKAPQNLSTDRRWLVRWHNGELALLHNLGMRECIHPPVAYILTDTTKMFWSLLKVHNLSTDLQALEQYTNRISLHKQYSDQNQYRHYYCCRSDKRPF
jgi:hypothetical protein